MLQAKKIPIDVQNSLKKQQKKQSRAFSEEKRERETKNYQSPASSSDHRQCDKYSYTYRQIFDVTCGQTETIGSVHKLCYTFLNIFVSRTPSPPCHMSRYFAYTYICSSEIKHYVVGHISNFIFKNCVFIDFCEYSNKNYSYSYFVRNKIQLYIKKYN